MITNGNGKNGNTQTTYHKKRFLEHYVELCVIGKAAEAAGVCRRTVEKWREQDKQFLADFESAKKSIVEKLEAEAIRRAYAGIDKAVWYKGEECGIEKEYSDTLLIFLLKGAAPEKYRERIEHTGEGGEPIKATFTFIFPEGFVPCPGGLFLGNSDKKKA